MRSCAVVVGAGSRDAHHGCRDQVCARKCRVRTCCQPCHCQANRGNLLDEQTSHSCLHRLVRSHVTDHSACWRGWLPSRESLRDSTWHESKFQDNNRCWNRARNTPFPTPSDSNPTTTKC